MPLLIVVAALIVGGVVWRARVARRLTMEESVDRYRRTLNAVHDAATRSSSGETPPPAAQRFTPRSPRAARGAPSRGLLVAAGAAIAVVAVIAIVVTHHGGKSHPRASAPTTTRPPATRPTTTTAAAPTTTVPLVRPTDATGIAFTISKPTYTMVLQSTSGACWVEAHGPTGSSLFAGLVASGGSQSITAGTATVRLGNPSAVTLTIDGTAVPFTVHNGAPLTLHLTATASAA